MAPYYRIVTSIGALPLDQALLDSMEKANKEELEKLDARLAEAETTEGESDIADALRARANFLTRTGEKVCHCFSFCCAFHGCSSISSMYRTRR